MATAYLHINGTTYQYAHEVNGPLDPAFQGLEKQVGVLAGGGGPGVIGIPVTLDGQVINLQVLVDQIATVALWTQEAPATTNDDVPALGGRRRGLL